VHDFSAKTILITGGTGSFGNELLQLLLRGSFGEVRIFSRDELKQDVMRNKLRSSNVRFHIGDVRDRASVDAVMKGVDYVFHAAALKQVPSCEFFPMQAVMTNIVGSHNVIDSAVEHGVSKVVALSTDKAVYPINSMGMTKALMEKIMQSVARRIGNGGTVLSVVRYGNVMCSRGSVIPLFVGQLKEGVPLTVTMPGMTRFLLRLSDAIDLVIFAFREGDQGDILIRKAPACTIDVLAEALQQIFGRDVGTRLVGMRHGEKLYETLATFAELAKSHDFGDYYRVTMDSRELNYEQYFTEGSETAAEAADYTSHNTERLDLAAVKSLLLSLPEIQAELGA
jgi:UDP-N-acetylglucosamine 4,6-dehydratase/5-epimerase